MQQVDNAAEMKARAKKKMITKVLVALIIAGVGLPLLAIVAFSSMPGRIVGFIFYFLVISFGLYEFAKILPLGKWAKYYIPLLTFVFAFYPFQDFKDWIIMDKQTLVFDEFISSQYAFRIFGIDGLGYVITAVYLFFPFLFVKWNKLTIWSYLLVTAATIMIGIAGKNLFYLNGGDFWFMIIIIISAALTDSFAYFGGKLLGNKIFKRKLAPKISPNKTIEGAIIGYLVGFVVAFGSLFNHQFANNFTLVWWVQQILIPLTLPIVAIIGDLMFSLVKRIMHIKDFASLIPEHGGLLDRLDSIIVVTFFYLMIFLI